MIIEYQGNLALLGIILVLAICVQLYGQDLLFS